MRAGVGCALCTTLSENPEHGGEACSCVMGMCHLAARMAAATRHVASRVM